jgi:hypothetical protein
MRRTRESPGGLDDECAASRTLDLIVGSGAGDHGRKLRHRLPPGGKGDEREDEMGGVEPIVEQAGSLRFGEPLNLFPVVSRTTDRICRLTALQPLPLQQTAKFRVG